MLGIIDTQGGGLEAAEGGGGAEAGSGGRVRQAEAEMKKECRLPTAFACHCQLLWFISPETFLRQDLQLRHPCSSCAVLSRGFRGSDFGGFRAFEAQACNLSCVCCSSSFAHHARPNYPKVRPSAAAVAGGCCAAKVPGVICCTSVCDMSVLECVGCMGSYLEVLHFCLWPRGEFLGARFWFVLVALLCLRFQTSSWMRARRFHRPRLPEPWIFQTCLQSAAGKQCFPPLSLQHANN